MRDRAAGTPGTRARRGAAPGGREGIVSPCLRLWLAGAVTLRLVHRPGLPPLPAAFMYCCGVCCGGSPFIILFGGGCFSASSPSPNWLTFSIVTRIKSKISFPFHEASFLSWPCWLPTLLTLPGAGRGLPSNHRLPEPGQTPAPPPQHRVLGRLR